MSDVLSFFETGKAPDEFTVSLWLYNSTKGVVALGPQMASCLEAEELLREYSGLPLVFKGNSTPAERLANASYKAGVNLAIVSSGGDAVSVAGLPEGWLPPDLTRMRLRP